MPLHPRTKKILQSGDYNISNLTIFEPVSYLNMVWLIEHCALVMTDSGGLQKEAFFFSKPCITFRDETEWIELIDNGFNKLVSAEKNEIADCFQSAEFNTDCLIDLYGSGTASKRIV